MYMCVCVCIKYIHVSASALQFTINIIWRDKDQNQESKKEKLYPPTAPSPGDDHSSFASLQYSGVGAEMNWTQLHPVQ